MTEPLDNLLTDADARPGDGLVLKIAIPRPLRQSYDYLPPPGVDAASLQAGLRVEVPFRSGKTVGYLLAVGHSDATVKARLKPALSLLDRESLLSSDDCAILRWASRYYHHPIGEVVATAFPVLLRQGGSAAAERERFLCLTETGRDAPPPARAPRQVLLLQALQGREPGVPVHELNALGWDWHAPARALVDKGWACYREEDATAPPGPPVAASPHQLNPAQQAAVDAVLAALDGYQAFLLEGVTGSGKTEGYLRLAEHVLARGGQVMVLLPEINLTPQLEARFRARLAAPLVVFHSGLSEPERCRAWLAMRGGTASILLGTRSAVFTPLPRPGLIILDEEHDGSFKQQDHFRFSARDIAVMRARRLAVPIVMGSATPSLESLGNVQRGRYVRLALPERTGVAAPPQFRLVDIRSQRLNEGLSAALVAQIGAALARGEQALLFLNRRGYAPTLICHACGWVAECARCDARLVIHAAERTLRCHHCGHEEALRRDCPKCRTADLRPLGLGTERVEQALAKLFPKARALRMDRDSTRRKGSLEAMLDQINAGQVDILLGTQMLAKGHHFPNVTLVGILDVDGGLFSLDFRAGERTAQLIVQVAGRAGREHRPGLVLLQTRQPEHPLLRKLIQSGYPAFAEAALQERREAELPPYSHQALWRAEAHDEAAPALFLTRLGELCAAHSEVLALGPVPAPMPRVSGRWRSQLLLQSAERKPLHELVETLIRYLPHIPETKRVRWSVDIDPLDLY